MNRSEIAKANFKKGYNCAQAVVVTYADVMGISETQALKMASVFGGGMGKLREVCGAVSGMLMVYGAIGGYSSYDDLEEKAQVYKKVRDLAGEFSEQNGSIVCKELLGLTKKEKSGDPAERTKEYYQKRPCAELVRIAAEIVEKYI